MKVKCVSNRGYYNLTAGKEYDVIQMIPATIMENGFVFPKYVEVIGDDGNNIIGHAYRFETLDGISCEKYIK